MRLMVKGVALKKLMPLGGGSMFSIGTPEDQGFSGVPIQSVSSAGGRPVTSEITEVSRQTFPDSVFQAPAGYQKTSMMLRARTTLNQSARSAATGSMRVARRAGA